MQQVDVLDEESNMQLTETEIANILAEIDEHEESEKQQNNNTNLIRSLTKSAQKAKSEISELIHSKSYKNIDKNIEQQQEKENYTLSTQDDDDDNWMEIVLTQNEKNNDYDLEQERKEYLNTIQLLNNKNDELQQQFNELKQRTDNNHNHDDIKDNEWQCTQCTYIQSIYTPQCIICKTMNPSFIQLPSYHNEQCEIQQNEKDFQFALKLQQEYKIMNEDEKLALELQKMEEKEAERNRKRDRRKSSDLFQISLGLSFLNLFVSKNNNNDHEHYEYEWQRLPIRSLTKKDIELLQKTEEKRSCPICMADFVEMDKTRQLPCFHLFHKDCIDIWFNQQNEKDNDASCPLDRKKIRDAVQCQF